MGSDTIWGYFNGTEGRARRAAVMENMTDDHVRETLVRAMLGEGTGNDESMPVTFTTLDIPVMVADVIHEMLPEIAAAVAAALQTQDIP